MPYVCTAPPVSSGGRQLSRTNRLDTRTGTKSRGAEGRATPGLGDTGGGSKEEE